MEQWSSGKSVNGVADRHPALDIYYTPNRVAEILARWAIRDENDTVLEPSFGGCALLEAAIARLLAVGCAEPGAQLSGFDVDPGAFAHLNTALAHRDGHANF